MSVIFSSTDYREIKTDDFRNKTDGEINELLWTYYFRIQQGNIQITDNNNVYIDNMVSLCRLYNVAPSSTLDTATWINCNNIRNMLRDFKNKHLYKLLLPGSENAYYWEHMLRITSFTNHYVYQKEYIYDTIRRYIDRNLNNDINIIKLFDSYYMENIVPYVSKLEDNRLFPYDTITKKIAQNVSRSWITNKFEWCDKNGFRICSAEDGEALPKNIILMSPPKYAPIYKVGDYSPSESTPTWKGWESF